jgi:formylglycine-generating enzyme required for sulfatase activity
VTVAEYTACVRTASCSKPQEGTACNWGNAERDKHPVNCVGVNQARTYCDWLGKRLPTKVEWTYAAFGSLKRAFPWGDRDPTTELCWQRSVSQGTCVVGSHPKDRSPFGVLDMGGNLSEWVQNGLLGGSWESLNPLSLREELTNGSLPIQIGDKVGFRCAR